jgi:hypothetical protein
MTTPQKDEKIEARRPIFLVILLGLCTIKRGCSLEGLNEVYSYTKVNAPTTHPMFNGGEKPHEMVM